ncbi:hypothetical protein ACFFX0_32495 [Citricoccus parietis]|uniref:Uncharacterized protein n=1 Tax=Citricoccus parietis TaxID=592307 RepID=A0ABV5G9M0_9MICC
MRKPARTSPGTWGHLAGNAGIAGSAGFASLRVNDDGCSSTNGIASITAPTGVLGSAPWVCRFVSDLAAGMQRAGDGRRPPKPVALCAGACPSPRALRALWASSRQPGTEVAQASGFVCAMPVGGLPTAAMMVRRRDENRRGPRIAHRGTSTTAVNAER